MAKFSIIPQSEVAVKGYRNGSTTRATIRNLRIMHPGYTLQEIGREAGVTRERARQVLAMEGLSTFSERTYMHVCPKCGERMGAEPKTQCLECTRKEMWIDVKCNWCGKDIKRRKHIHKYRTEVNTHGRYKGNYYCNRTCLGHWLGKNHGVQTRTEVYRTITKNAKEHREIARSYDFLMRDEVAKELFVGNSTVSNWIKKGKIQATRSPYKRIPLIPVEEVERLKAAKAR